MGRPPSVHCFRGTQMERAPRFNFKGLRLEVREKMSRERLSYVRASGRIGVTYATLWHFVSHECEPGVNATIAICAWLGKRIDSFVVSQHQQGFVGLTQLSKGPRQRKKEGPQNFS